MGYPDDSDSNESDAVLTAIHRACMSLLGGADDDAVLPGDRRVVIGVEWPTADAKGQRLFFFDHDRLVGEDLHGYLPMTVNAHVTSPDAFIASYSGVGTWPGAATGFGGQLRVKFIWPVDGAPRAVDRLPSHAYPARPAPDPSETDLQAHAHGQVTCWY